jgi:hypothetical protein
MFPLNTKTFPASSAELVRDLNASLRALFGLTHDAVAVRDKAYPHLEALTVSLDGAALPDRPPPMPSVNGPRRPALSIDSFLAGASPLSIGPASFEFKLEAERVDLEQAIDRDGNVVLLLHNAAKGQVDISVATAELEALIGEVAKTEAAKHGVNVDSVELTLRSRGQRSLAAEVRLRAKKLFVSASLRITGEVDLDEQLNARISGLQCLGDGAIASVACGILKPHLQALDGREFSLMSLPLGEVRLRDVRIAVSERLAVTAEFGSAHE